MKSPPEASEVVDTSHQHDDHFWSDLVVGRLPLFDGAVKQRRRIGEKHFAPEEITWANRLTPKIWVLKLSTLKPIWGRILCLHCFGTSTLLRGLESFRVFLHLLNFLPEPAKEIMQQHAVLELMQTSKTTHLILWLRASTSSHNKLSAPSGVPAAHNSAPLALATRQLSASPHQHQWYPQLPQSKLVPTAQNQNVTVFKKEILSNHYRHKLVK